MAEDTERQLEDGRPAAGRPAVHDPSQQPSGVVRKPKWQVRLCLKGTLLAELYTCISLWAIVGCYARIFTERLFGPTALNVTVDDTLLVPAFFSNCCGCVALGLIIASFAAIDKEGGSLVFLTGLTTGFCGSYTTYSSWIGETDDLVIASQDVAPPQPQLGGIIYICAGLCCFIVAHRVGMDIGEAAQCGANALAPRLRHNRAPLLYFNLALLAAALVTLAALLGAADLSWEHRVWVLSGMFAPAGALARFALARALNGFRGGRFPLGTLAANVGGTVAVALAAHGYRAAPDWPDTVLRALVMGFCGCLTTMSTLVNEVAAVRADFGAYAGFLYLGTSVVLAEVLAGVIDAWE